MSTPGADGAQCRLVDSAGETYFVKSTPYTVVVNRGDGPLTITCEKTGFKTAEAVFDEKYAAWILGNVIAGGIIGAVIDATSGAGQEYPDDLRLFMEPHKWGTKEQKQRWLKDKAAYEDKLKTNGGED